MIDADAVHDTGSEGETIAVARALAARLQPGTTVLLSGDLGAGKTAFVRGLAEGLGLDPAEVTSPTFTLAHEYRGGRLPLLHVDLYRLERVDLDDLGIDPDAVRDGVVAVEWAERLVRELGDVVRVRIEDRGGDERRIAIARVSSTRSGSSALP